MNRLPWVDKLMARCTELKPKTYEIENIFPPHMEVKSTNEACDFVGRYYEVCTQQALSGLTPVTHSGGSETVPDLRNDTDSVWVETKACRLQPRKYVAFPVGQRERYSAAARDGFPQDRVILYAIWFYNPNNYLGARLGRMKTYSELYRALQRGTKGLLITDSFWLGRLCEGVGKRHRKLGAGKRLAKDTIYQNELHNFPALRNPEVFKNLDALVDRLSGEWDEIPTYLQRYTADPISTFPWFEGLVPVKILMHNYTFTRSDVYDVLVDLI